MKKLVSIVLSLVLALTACAALATDSPTNMFDICVLSADETPAWISEITAVDGDEGQTLLEVIPMQFINYVPELGDQEVVITTTCGLVEGQDVAAKIAELVAEDNILWTDVEVSVVDNDTIKVVLPCELLIELGDEPFALALLSK